MTIDFYHEIWSNRTKTKDKNPSAVWSYLWYWLENDKVGLKSIPIMRRGKFEISYCLFTCCFSVLHSVLGVDRWKSKRLTRVCMLRVQLYTWGCLMSGNGMRPNKVTLYRPWESLSLIFEKNIDSVSQMTIFQKHRQVIFLKQKCIIYENISI